MDTVLIAIASPAKAELDDILLKSIMDRAGIDGSANWLSASEAVEVPFQPEPGFDALETETAIRSMLADQAIDIAFVPSQNRKKKLLIADMDSTIIEQECIDELGDFAGVGDEAKQITARAMAGELDFEGALAARLNLMKGLPEEFIIKVIDTRLTLTPGARTLVQTMKNNGAITALVSGGFIRFVSHIAAMCGFDEHQANTLEIIQGKLTGNVLGTVLDQRAKKRAISRIVMLNALSFADTLAVGDGSNDIPMVQRASMGVALHGKEKLRHAARYRIDHCDLTSLLYLQGYHKEEFTDNPVSKHDIQITTS